jgi:hypothetical protein
MLTPVRNRRTIRLGLLAVLVTAASGVPAQASLGATEPQILEGDGAGSTHLVAAANGSRSLVSIAGQGYPGRLRALAWHAEPGQPFGAPVVVGSTGSQGQVADVGVSADGSGLVALDRGRNGRSVVRYRSFDARRRLHAPVTISASGRNSHVDALVVARSGAALLVWTEENPHHHLDSRLRAAIRAPGKAAFAKPQTIDKDVETSGKLRAAINDTGAAVATWSTGDGDVTHAAALPAGGKFAKPRTLRGDAGNRSAVAIGSTGAGLIVTAEYRSTPHDAFNGVAWFVTPVDGTTRLAPSRTLLLTHGYPDQLTSDQPSVSADVSEAGTAAVTFVYTSKETPKSSPDHRGAQLAVFAGPPAKLRRVATLGADRRFGPMSPVLALDASDRALVAWTFTDVSVQRSPQHVQAATTASITGAAFGPPQTASPTSKMTWEPRPLTGAYTTTGPQVVYGIPPGGVRAACRKRLGCQLGVVPLH